MFGRRQGTTSHLEVCGDDLVLVHGAWANVVASGQVEQEDQDQGSRHNYDSYSQGRLAHGLTWPASWQAILVYAR